jgi:hypothetical protein
MMSRTFTSADDATQIQLIRSASKRLAVIGPGLTISVAESLADRLQDMPDLAITIILDADPEVYRMGYGDIEALTVIREASIASQFDLREQAGIRIGIIISDDTTMIFAPVSRNIEAGSTSPEHPNAILLGSNAASELAVASGVTSSDDREEQSQEIGTEALTPEKANAVEKDLEANPPDPVDLTRKLRVFRSEVQFIDLTLSNALFSSRTIKLPSEFQKIANGELRDGIKSSLKIPLDAKKSIKVKIGEEIFEISEASLKRERVELEKSFIYDWKGRGKVILRQDKTLFEDKVEALTSLTKSFQEAMRLELNSHRNNFCDKMVDEFLEYWEKSPPARLKNRNKTSPEDLQNDIRHRAGEMFDRAVDIGTPEATKIYKDISIEDLQDEELMSELKKLMVSAAVDPETVQKLFQSSDAVEVGTRS